MSDTPTTGTPSNPLAGRPISVGYEVISPGQVTRETRDGLQWDLPVMASVARAAAWTKAWSLSWRCVWFGAMRVRRTTLDLTGDRLLVLRGGRVADLFEIGQIRGPRVRRVPFAGCASLLLASRHGPWVELWFGPIENVNAVAAELRAALFTRT